MKATSITRTILIVFLSVFLVSCEEKIIHNLSEYDANMLVTRLQKIQVEAEKVQQSDGRWSLAVSDGDALRAIDFLSSSRAIRNNRSTGKRASTILSSPEQQRAGLGNDIAAELEESLLSISGVLDARVHLNLPSKRGLFERSDKKQTGSASVLLLCSQELNLNTSEVAALVAGASGIEKKNISVLQSVLEEARIDDSVITVSDTSLLPERSEMRRSILIPLGIGLFLVGIASLIVLLKRRREHPFSPLEEMAHE